MRPDLLLVMGGPMSVNDPDSWLADELAYIRQVVESGTKYLGICLGSQLLAKAMGGRVAPSPAPEIGMTELSRTDEGSADRLFRNWPGTFEAVEWHGEGIELPPGAACLASSKLFPVQAFRVGSRAYGLLFHLELDADGLAALCCNCPEDVRKSGLDSERLLQSCTPHLPSLQRRARELIAALVATGR